ncbi:hypothetical protein [Veronia pacifica]|uniref:Uncharacterized protein n=2 Tax=Veronia pacifica TaxID=1080227 RepID=A0A1C3E9J6_9GAMM|nr:hypothetical protein [Veronia pacifica]ODA29903.1 hypothetical protein A8L45_21335 [Veronia pacifica]
MLEDEDGKRQKVNAWEGLALSKESNKMVWSDTQTPFFGSNLIASGWNYLTAPSRLWVGDFIYQRQNSIIKNAREIVSKYDIGLIFLEPQNFLGENDEKVTFSAYGPTSNGAANTYLYNFKKQVIEHIRIGEGYQEWEGASPDYQRSFVEVQQDASRFIGPTNVELYLYDFNNEDLSRFSFFRGNEKNIHDLYLHEPVFSPDGKNVLVTIGGGDGWEINSPGYGLGILIINIDDLLLIYTKE